jgi:hypothetical protein
MAHARRFALAREHAFTALRSRLRRRALVNAAERASRMRHRVSFAGAFMKRLQRTSRRRLRSRVVNVV